MNAQQPKRILVFRIGNLGDTVVALPAMQAVRRRFPEGHLTLFTGRNPDTGYVVANAVIPPGLFDECMTFEQSDRGSDPRGMLKLVPQLWRHRYDLLVYLPPRLRPERLIHRDLLFFKMAGVRRIVGHQGRMPLGARCPGEPIRGYEHEADYLLERVAAGGIPVPAAAERAIDLGLTGEELAFARDYLVRCRVPLDGFPVAIAPGTKWSSKQWPEASFADLGARLMACHHAFPVVVGGREDAALGDRLVRGWGRGINIAGELSIRHSAAALSLCSMFVGTDSGPLHLAAAVGVPCVGVFAAIDYPGRWHPYGSGHITVRHDVDCAGCMLPVCVERNMECLRSIAVDEVMAACDRMLAQAQVRTMA